MRTEQTPENKSLHNSILIKSPFTIRITGIVGVIFGCLMSFWCYGDYLRGNETATVGIAVGFLVIPGILGLWLILYSLRFVRIEGEDILFRDILLRSRRCRMDDICRVKWIADGYVLMGSHGKLFKIYDYSYACERLFLELEKRGVEVDIPGRVFSASVINACHPCPAKRRFTVKFMACSVRFFGRLEVNGSRIKLYRIFSKESLYHISDIKEVRVRENKEHRLSIRIFLENGKKLVKLEGGAGGGTDSNCVFALLRHLKEFGVPIHGLEKTDDAVQCMMRSGFVAEQSAQALFQKEYERILPIFQEYEAACFKVGLQLVYGPLGKADIAKQENIWKNEAWKKEGVFPDAFQLEGLMYACYFCILIDGKVACDKKRKLPLYQYLQIVSKKSEVSGTQAVGPGQTACEDETRGYLYFLPVPEQVVRVMMDMTLVMAKKKKIGVSEVVWKNEE